MVGESSRTQIRYEIDRYVDGNLGTFEGPAKGGFIDGFFGLAVNRVTLTV